MQPSLGGRNSGPLVRSGSRRLQKTGNGFPVARARLAQTLSLEIDVSTDADAVSIIADRLSSKCRRCAKSIGGYNHGRYRRFPDIWSIEGPVSTRLAADGAALIGRRLRAVRGHRLANRAAHDPHRTLSAAGAMRVDALKAVIRLVLSIRLAQIYSVNFWFRLAFRRSAEPPS